MLNVKKLATLLAIGSCLFCAAAPAVAQQASRSETANISDQDLRAFAKAYVENQKIRQKYEPTLVETPDPKQSKPIQDRANEELKQALAKNNLTIEKYNTIYTRVNSDDGLRQKVLKMVEEERQRSA